MIDLIRHKTMAGRRWLMRACACVHSIAPGIATGISTGIAFLSVSAGAAHAGDLSVDLEVAGELRYFPGAPLNPGQLETFQPSFTLLPELAWESDDRTHQVVFNPFLRVDGRDGERTHFDLREAYYRFNKGSDWSLTVGLAKVFWGRTESRHLVDIINQTDAVEDIDEEDKLGQPMVNLTFFNDWGVLDFFLLSGFRDRTFPGEAGRLRFGLVIDTDNPVFERPGRRAAPDFAARYSHYVGSFDFGVALFHGTAREPRFLIDPDAALSSPGIRPIYDRITQGSVDVQFTNNAWLWKAEAIVREGQGETFLAAVGGFEYTLYQIFGSNADLGLLSEYQFDGRDDGLVVDAFGLATAAPVTPADNDVFVGARLAFNDTQNASALVGATIDANDQTTGLFIEATRRLGENWTADLEARLFVNVDPDNLVDAFRNDDFLTLRLTRYF